VSPLLSERTALSIIEAGAMAMNTSILADEDFSAAEFSVGSGVLVDLFAMIRKAGSTNPH
jgi:hypothetical protein